MSKLKRPILIMLFGCAMAALLSGRVRAQAEVQITIDPVGRTAVVNGKFGTSDGPRRNLSFLPSAIGAADLGKRISNVQLSDARGQAVPYKAFNSAEYAAESAFTVFQYSVDLASATDPRAAAHSSWLSSEAGLIYLDDVIPLAVKNVLVKLEMPGGWGTTTTEMAAGKDSFKIDDARRAVFIVGNRIRSNPNPHRGPVLATSGDWLFTDVEAAEMAAEIFREYSEIFGPLPNNSPMVALLAMPQTGVPKGTWEAETRGSTVVIASADMAFRTHSLQRLHEQLRHELFHLWVPNAVNLTGRYDWFYEGFALYQSLKTGVSLNRIRFDDMLDTLSRAHNIDKSEVVRRSLIEASNERWAGAETLVYARGMLAAFLIDLELMRASGGKRSVGSLLRNIYTSHKGAATATDGNAAILKVLNDDRAAASISRDHISGSKPIDWTSAIESAGLENEPRASRTKLRIRSNLTGRQKAMLDKLGYNSWRKLTRK